jgi:hypothetical protein
MKPHPLFPPRDDDHDAPAVYTISVGRFGPDGLKFHPTEYAAEDITTLADLFAIHGPGSYELVAKDENKQFVRKVRHKIDNLSPDAPAAPPPAAPPPAAGGLPTGLGDLGALLGFLGTLMTNQTNMMTAVIAASNTSSEKLATAMAGAQQQNQQAMAAIVTAVLSKASDGGTEGVLGILSKGIELGRDSVPEAEIETGDDISLDEGVEAFTKGIDAVNKLQGLNPPAPGGPAGAARPPPRPPAKPAGAKPAARPPAPNPAAVKPGNGQGSAGAP